MSKELQIVTSSHIKPHFIKELNEDGLLAYDIAKSLKARPDDIRKKIRKYFFSGQEISQYCRAAEFSAPNNSNGLHTKEIALNLRAAKVFIATYRNKIGVSYLDFLFECERVATELTPKIMLELEQLKKQLQAAEASLINGTKQLKKASKKGMVIAPQYYHNIFGNIEIKWEMRQKELLNEIEIIKAKERQLRKTLNGMVKKLEEYDLRKEQLELKQTNKFLKMQK